VIWRCSGCGLSEALHKSLRFIPNPDEDTQAPKAHPYGVRPVERHRATLQLQLRIVSACGGQRLSESDAVAGLRLSG
jgi:hypothetical protein